MKDVSQLSPPTEPACTTYKGVKVTDDVVGSGAGSDGGCGAGAGEAHGCTVIRHELHDTVVVEAEQLGVGGNGAGRGAGHVTAAHAWVAVAVHGALCVILTQPPQQ